MMRLAGPRSAPRRTWIAIAFIGGVSVYLAWPAGGESGTEFVEAAMPQRESDSRQRTATMQLGYAERGNTEVTSTNLFASHSWYVAPPPPPQQPAMSIVPTAPPLPFSFLGRYARTGELPVFLLVKNDRIYNVRVGDVLDKQYSIDAVENGLLRMTYLPLGIKQSLAVGGTP